MEKAFLENVYSLKDYFCVALITSSFKLFLDDTPTWVPEPDRGKVVF